MKMKTATAATNVMNATAYACDVLLYFYIVSPVVSERRQFVETVLCVAGDNQMLLNNLLIKEHTF